MVALSPDGETLVSTFTLGDLRTGREKTGRDLYRGTYIRRWATGLSSTQSDDPDDWFSLELGYEESHDGRPSITDKPRVFVNSTGTGEKCVGGTVTFQPGKQRVVTRIPLRCFANDFVRGKELTVSGMSRTVGFGRDDRYRDLGGT